MYDETRLIGDIAPAARLARVAESKKCRKDKLPQLQLSQNWEGGCPRRERVFA